MPRSIAYQVLNSTLNQQQPFDKAYDRYSVGKDITTRDLRFAFNLTVTTLRYLGQIDNIISKCLTKKLPHKAKYAQIILRLGVCQLIFLNVPSHAAVNTSVELAKKNRQDAYKKLINAILRRVDKERLIILEDQDSAKLNTPVWMWDSWVKAYGADATRKIAESHLKIPNIDLTAKSEPKFWADKLHGHLLSTGSIRLNSPGDPSNLDGFKQGSWWIQDAGASIPVQLFGNNIKGKTIADLCAAPGGKTAQLAAAQAKVIAIDKNESRLETLKNNLKRLRLTSEIICTDALDWRPKKLLDGVLIDAPCTATGTIRRHPDIKHLKKRDDVLKAQKLQLKLLEAASKMITKKGQIVFSTCSLQPEEGEQVVNIFLSQNLGWQRKPFESNFINIFNNFITKSGDIRTLPFHFNMDDHTQKKPIPSGIDGFFSTCLIRK